MFLLHNTNIRCTLNMLGKQNNKAFKWYLLLNPELDCSICCPSYSVVARNDLIRTIKKFSIFLLHFMRQDSSTFVSDICFFFHLLDNTKETNWSNLLPRPGYANPITHKIGIIPIFAVLYEPVFSESANYKNGDHKYHI